MKKSKKIWLIVVIVLVVISIVYLENSRMGSIPSEQSSVNIVETSKGQFQQAPELVGISGYLNTNNEEIKLEDYRGKVVLIDFWTYTCINCIRTFPFLKDWDKKYRDDGLVIIGVHTPEFEFEKDYDNVASAIDKHEIEYGVVQDNDYETWRAYNNRFWPRKYLIDKDGLIRYDHIGEGAYTETEEVIQQLLSELNGEIEEDMSDIQDITPTTQNTPELYAGYSFALSRGQNVGNEQGLVPEAIVDYTFPDQIKTDRIYLQGEWVSKEDYIQSQDDELSILALNFLAKNVNFVADPVGGPVEVDVFINAKYIPQNSAGADVKYDGERSYILVDLPDLYNVYNGEYGRNTLFLETNSTSFAISAFTFG